LNTTSATVSHLPASGTVYLTLYTLTSSGYQLNSYTLTLP
jgi:hypothetical protein